MVIEGFACTRVVTMDVIMHDVNVPRVCIATKTHKKVPPRKIKTSIKDAGVAQRIDHAGVCSSHAVPDRGIAATRSRSHAAPARLHPAKCSSSAVRLAGCTEAFPYDDDVKICVYIHPGYTQEEM